MDKIIKIEASGDFPFSFFIEKAIAGDDMEQMTIKGVASTVNIDHDNERMSAESLKAMAEIINEKSVPLRVEHQKDDNSIVGNVNKAWVDSRNQLWIEADLDKSHPGASMLYKALKTGAKLGLSVGGRVKHAVKEFSEAAGKMVKTFYNVVLDEVSVTSRPANYDAWLVSKSIISKESDGENFVESPFYKEFLFENQSLDYMQSFAKSIPDASWKKKINNMEKDIKKDSDKKDEETKEEMKSADGGEEKKEPEKDEPKETANKSEEAFKSMVMKGFETLASMISKIKKSADRGTSDEGTEDTTIMPDKKEKAMDDETKEDEKKEKSEEKEDETKEKAADDEKKDDEMSEKNSDYNLNAMKSILKKMENLSKAMDGTDDETKEKEKAADDEGKKDEETTEKSLDKFVEVLEKSVNDLQEKFEKGGKRFPGLTQMIVNSLRNDAEVQKEIKEMINEPGFKKSMQFGVPMMRTKDGKSYRLTATLEGEEVAKSKKDNAGKTFKEVYNKDFSSSANAGE